MMNSAIKIANRETDRYLSEPELRSYLGYSPSTIRRLRHKGLPSIGQDRLRRYHIGIVLQWLSLNVSARPRAPKPLTQPYPESEGQG